MTSKLLNTWTGLHEKPLGKWIFSKVIGHLIPYTGSIKPKVLKIEPGFAEVLIKDRRAIRNHLNCIHALAQLNLAEFCTGLAMTARLGDQGRAIITELSMSYFKKGRGTLVARCQCPEFKIDNGKDLILIADVFNAEGVLVSQGKAHWRVSPHPQKQASE